MTLLSSLELCLNTALQRDPHTVKRLQAYQDRTLGVCLQPMGLCLYFTGSPEGLSLSDTPPATVDAMLTGTPWQFIKLATAENSGNQKHILTHEMAFSGDAVFASEWQQIFQSLDLDWESALAELLPEGVVHQLSQSLKQLGAFIKTRKTSSKTYVTDLIQEECRLSPSRLEADDFFNDITELTVDLARVTARINRLSPPE